jgi:2'-5' RNA ligase
MQRLFFALLPSAELRQQFEKIRLPYLENSIAKAVHFENLHITLAFLGDVSEFQRQCFENAADSLIFKPFTLSLDRVGYWRKPQILWLGTTQICEPLHYVVKSLHEKCHSCGFKPDVRPYQAHITLARQYYSRQFQSTDISPIFWSVRNIHLMESTFSAIGVHYKVLRSWQAE